jgi:hypothetical protein
MRNLICAALLVAPLAARAESKVKPGQYTVTITMDMEGMPQQMPPMTMQKCVTPEDAKDPSSVVRAGKGGHEHDCEMKDKKIEGNKVTWTMDCKQKGHGTGSITISGDSYEAVTHLEMVDKSGTPRKMTSTVKAKRTGECSAQ